MAQGQRSNPQARLTVAFWAATAVLLLAAAWSTRIDFYDSFDYLRNARRLAGAEVGFSARRPPLVPLLHAPVQAVLDAVGAEGAARVVVPHLLQAALTAALLAAFYSYLALFFPKGWALAGCALLSLNRTLIHYSHAVMTDIPAALFVVLFLLWSRGGGRARAALALTACLLSRWNMLLFPAALLAFRRSLPAVAAAAAASVAASLAVLEWAEPAPLSVAARFLARVLWTGGATQFDDTLAPEPWWENLWFFPDSAGWACALSALAALPRTARDRETRFHAAFLLGFTAVMSFGFGQKESRFLIPVFPSFYFLALAGLKDAAGRVRSKAALAALVGAFTLPGALAEWRAFLEPAYRSTILLDAARAARPAAGVFWDGAAGSVVPRNRRAPRGDESFDLYHVPSRASLEYLLGRRVELVYPGRSFAEGDMILQAPKRLFLHERPISREENRLRILEFQGKTQRETAVLIPPG